jgi:hypothetical protein
VLTLPYWFADHLNGYLGVTQKSVFCLGVMLSVNSAVGGFNGVLTGCHRWELQTMRNVGWYVISVIGMVLALWMGYGLLALAAITAFCTIMGQLTVVALAYRVCPGLKLRMADVHWKTMKELYTYCGKSLVPTISEMLLNQMASLGYKPTRILTASACGYTGIFKTIESLDGSFCTAFLPAPGSNDPKWQAFTKAMGQYAAGQPADIYAAWGWLAGEVAVAGLERIQGPITRENFVNALNTLKDLPTIGGKLTYTAQSHSGICCQFLWQAKKDHWEVVPGSDFDGLK